MDGTGNISRCIKNWLRERATQYSRDMLSPPAMSSQLLLMLKMTLGPMLRCCDVLSKKYKFLKNAFWFFQTKR